MNEGNEIKKDIDLLKKSVGRTKQEDTLDNWSDRVSGQLGNYFLRVKEDTRESENTRLLDLLNKIGLEGQGILYKGCKKTTEKDKRRAFVTRVGAISENNDNIIKKTKEEMNEPRDGTVTLKTLLGKHYNSYKEALKEEQESIDFRNAVLLNSTKHYEGAKWKDKMILWVGGPSSSGKSHGTDGVVKLMNNEIMEKELNNEEGNDVVTVDGGVEREVSQVRRLALQLALQKGYSGISDLHDNSKGLSTKGVIKRVALKCPGLNVVIPNTFSDPFRKDSVKSEMNKYHKMKGVVHAFSDVVGIGKDNKDKHFKKTVQRMGEDRAWSKKYGVFEVKGPLSFDLESHEKLCESKNYNKEYFDRGVNGTKEAKKAYKNISEGKSVVLQIRNDLVYLQWSDEANKLVKYEGGPEGKNRIERVSMRAYNDYCKYYDKKITTCEDAYNWIKTAQKIEEYTAPIINVQNNDYEVGRINHKRHGVDLKDNPNDEQSNERVENHTDSTENSGPKRGNINYIEGENKRNMRKAGIWKHWENNSNDVPGRDDDTNEKSNENKPNQNSYTSDGMERNQWRKGKVNRLVEMTNNNNNLTHDQTSNNEYEVKNRNLENQKSGVFYDFNNNRINESMSSKTMSRDSVDDIRRIYNTTKVLGKESNLKLNNRSINALTKDSDGREKTINEMTSIPGNEDNKDTNNPQGTRPKRGL